MEYENIRYEVDQGVALITLNRPERLNTFNYAMFRDLHAALDVVRQDDDVRVLMFTGAPRPAPHSHRASVLPRRPGGADDRQVP